MMMNPNMMNPNMMNPSAMNPPKKEIQSISAKREPKTFCKTKTF